MMGKIQFPTRPKTYPRRIVRPSLSVHNYIMFPATELLLVCSVLMGMVNSGPSPTAEDLAVHPDDVQFTDVFTNDPSNIDYFSTSADSTNPSGLDSTLDSDSVWNEENLLAGNGGSNDWCRAEDMSLLPSIGRFRARGERLPISARGEACNSQPLNSDQLPENLPTTKVSAQPTVEKRPDICPVEIYQNRQIPLCSSGNPLDEKVIDALIFLMHATSCKSLLGCSSNCQPPTRWRRHRS
jgi:hypothetical protein